MTEELKETVVDNVNEIINYDPRLVAENVIVTTYESGNDPVGSSQVRFNVRYYIFALMFVIFDVETVFLYPWAVAHRSLGLFALIEMLVFVLLLVVGLIYAWRKKVLRWTSI
jgi:NADH-quinone oxidoreductase subunit A